MSNETIQEGARILVEACARLKPNESALVVSDPQTEAWGRRVLCAAREISDRVRHCVIPSFAIHGQEPSAETARRMGQSDVIFGMTRMSMAHTAARLAATERGARYLSLPDYTERVLASPALRADFQTIAAEAGQIAQRFTQSNHLRVTTELGTNLTCDIRGRCGNAAPGVCDQPGALASPPDAESNVPPVEDGSNGVLVVDGSVPCAEIGLLESPLTLWVEGGRVVRVEGDMASTVEALFARSGNSSARVVAEVGVGLNPEARLCGSMLEDEGCRDTCHIGIGSNVTIGGRNAAPLHLDFVMRDALVEADGVAVL